MSKPLVKLVNSSILPAATLIVSKLLGFFVACSILHIDWNISKGSFTQSLFSVFIQVPSDAAQRVTVSYSNIIMLTALLIVLCVKIFQSEYLDDTKVSPKLLMKLAESNLLGLIRNSFDLYYENFLWVVFTWIGVFSILINTLMGYSNPMIFIIGFIFTSILTVFFIRGTN